MTSTRIYNMSKKNKIFPIVIKNLPIVNYFFFQTQCIPYLPLHRRGTLYVHKINDYKNLRLCLHARIMICLNFEYLHFCGFTSIWMPCENIYSPLEIWWCVRQAEYLIIKYVRWKKMCVETVTTLSGIFFYLSYDFGWNN